MTARKRKVPATVLIVCEDPSHKPKVAKIATFKEMLNRHDERVNIDLVRRYRRTDNGLELEVSTAVESPIGAGGKIVDSMSDDDEDHWHVQMRCPRCPGVNVPARRENLTPVLAKLMDAGVSRIDLAALARRLT